MAVRRPDHGEVVSEEGAGVALPVVQQPRCPAIDDQGQERRVLRGGADQVPGGEGGVQHDPVTGGDPQVQQVCALRADQDRQAAVGRSALGMGDRGRQRCPGLGGCPLVRLLVQAAQGVQGQALQGGPICGQHPLGRGRGHQHRQAHRVPFRGQSGHIGRGG